MLLYVHKYNTLLHIDTRIDAKPRGRPTCDLYDGARGSNAQMCCTLYKTEGGEQHLDNLPLFSGSFVTRILAYTLPPLAHNYGAVLLSVKLVHTFRRTEASCYLLGGLFGSVGTLCTFSLPPSVLISIEKKKIAMFSRNAYAILRRAQFNVLSKNIKYSTSTRETGERDPAPLFFDNDVQNLLKTLTRPDVKKIFRTRKDGKRIHDPEFKFLTDEELQAAYKDAEKRGLRRLKMPPVVKKRTEIDSVLSKDPELQGYDTATYVFTDITYGVSDYDRLIVVRQPDGILRHAKWAERQRLNQIYFPLKGREIDVPRMFQDEYLEDLLSRQEYEFVLNRACLQYEPNDPEYHRVSETVYAAVNKEKHFDHLRSTRHFGPLVFHLVWTRNMDNLLLENITTDKLEDAVLAIKLYNKIYPDAKSSGIRHDGDDMKFIREYIATESPIKGKLEVALNALKELRDARDSVAEGVKKAHGI